MIEEKASVSPKGKSAAKKVKRARFRLLPLVIFFSVLMFSVRVGVLWRSLFLSEAQQELVVSGVAVGKVQAQSQQEDLSKVAREAQNGTTPQTPMGGGMKTPDSSFSQSELEVLQKLAQRREELDVRERKIEQQAAVLKAAEAQIDAKVAKLRELEEAIKKLVGVYDEKERERLTNLVKIYSTMKPKDAARLFNDMEMDLLTRIFEGMKEAKSAPILAAMEPAKATALTSELANRKALPGFEDLGGPAPKK